jgi:hypothetical protein
MVSDHKTCIASKCIHTFTTPPACGKGHRRVTAVRMTTARWRPHATLDRCWGLAWHALHLNNNNVNTLHFTPTMHICFDPIA